MGTWVRCTRKFDNAPIYVNFGEVAWLRWNDEENFTAISWASGDENVVRVIEHPSQILSGNEISEPSVAEQVED